MSLNKKLEAKQEKKEQKANASTSLNKMTDDEPESVKPDYAPVKQNYNDWAGGELVKEAELSALEKAIANDMKLAEKEAAEK